MTFTVHQFGKRLNGQFGIQGTIKGLSSIDVRAQIVNANKRGAAIRITLDEDSQPIPQWHFAPTFPELIGIKFRGSGELVYSAHRYPEDIDIQLSDFGYTLVSTYGNCRQYKLTENQVSS
jgi:hypothetical protein